jgi:gamma-glutamylputrescine oxidase
MAPVSVAREDLRFWAEAPDGQPCAPLCGHACAEIAIIGGGFAGLSAAYHLIRTKPDLDIVLVEAGSVGSGASGRNTGMLGPRVGGSILDLCRRYGETEARRLYHTSLEAVDDVKALIASERISCDLEETPQVKAALTERQALALEAEAHTLERLGFRAPCYDENEMAQISPVPYRAGLCYPQSALLNPVLLCRELKRVVMRAGVRVHERTQVRSLAPGHPVRITLGDGTLTARHVVLATNAYTAQLGLLQGQVIPIHTHVIQTEPLSPAQLARLNWPLRTPFFEAGNIFNYFRLTPDNRILFGGGRPLYRAASGDRHSGATDLADPRVWQAQAEAFSTRFPALADVSISNRWSGAVGMTLDHLPVVGELTGAPGVFFAGGWNGHGVAMATASGAMISELVLGVGSGRTNVPWVRGSAPRIPGDPARAAALSVYLTALGLKDRLDAFRDRARFRVPTTNEVIT